MLRLSSYILLSLVLVFSLTACMDETELQELRDFQSSIMASQKAEKSASSSVESSVSSVESSVSSKSESSASGSTVVDNKPPSQGQKDGVTIHIPQSDIDKFNSEMSEFLENAPSISRDDIEYSYRDYEYSYPEYSTSDSWRDRLDGGRDSNGKYPWEYDENIPDLSHLVPTP